MADVFISYSKQDHAEARMLAAFLEAEGYSVWWDTQLDVGERFRQTIMQELGRARAVIVIWTENSVQSDWVMSEAGRALNDRKLIPVKSKGLAYKDIPPPFDNMHIVDVGEREKIRDTVVAKLAQPKVKPSAFKLASRKLRHELLSWIGIVGAVLTLGANLQSLIILAKWARQLFELWTHVVTFLWGHALFFLPKVYSTDALVLTFVLFAALNVLLSSRSHRDRKIKSGARNILSASISAALILFVFYQGLLRSVDELVSKGDWSSFGYYVDYHTDLSVSASAWLRSYLGGAEFGYGTAILAFVLGVLNFVVIPLLPAVLLSILLKYVLALRLSVAVLSSRLWRILIGLLLVIAINYAFLWLEQQSWVADMVR